MTLDPLPITNAGQIPTFFLAEPTATQLSLTQNDTVKDADRTKERRRIEVLAQHGLAELDAWEGYVSDISESQATYSRSISTTMEEYIGWRQIVWTLNG